MIFQGYFLFKILLFPLRFQSVSRNLKLLNWSFYQWKIILEFPILVVHDNNPGNCAVFKDYSILFAQPIVINNEMNAFQPSILYYEKSFTVDTLVFEKFV